METQKPSNTDTRTLLKDFILGGTNFDTSEGLETDDNLLEEGVLDSLGIAEITEFMETTFGIVIDDDEVLAENYRSINALAAFCEAKMAQSSRK